MITKIVDTHIHVWDLDKVEYSWLKGDTSILNRTYCIDELNQERIAAGITHGILVQAANNFGDTDWMLQVASENEWITGVVGWLPLMDCNSTEKALVERYLPEKYFKGVRHLIHNEQDYGWLLQDEVIRSLKVLAKCNIPYDVVGVVPQHIETVLAVSEKVPELRMVFDHLNQPPIHTDKKFGQWGALIRQASQHPNFYVKISGLGTIANNPENWSAEGIKHFLEFVIEQFGADRCFCGGDWPVSLLAGSYVKTWNIYKEALSGMLGEGELKKVLFENAVRFYDL